MSQDSLHKLEKSIVQSINSLKDEIINLKDIVIKKLQDENARLKEKCGKHEIVHEIKSIFRKIVVILGTRHIIYQQKGNFMEIKDLDISKPESVMLSYILLSSAGTLFLSHRKTQFLMSYWSMFISRFMGGCHSNEAKPGLKKIQQQSSGVIYQNILALSNNFAEISKITKKILR